MPVTLRGLSAWQTLDLLRAVINGVFIYYEIKCTQFISHMFVFNFRSVIMFFHIANVLINCANVLSCCLWSSEIEPRNEIKHKCVHPHLCMVGGEFSALLCPLFNLFAETHLKYFKELSTSKRS